MRVRKGQLYLRWSSLSDVKRYVKALYRSASGEWNVQPYDVALGKCVDKPYTVPAGLLQVSDVQLVVKREDLEKKARRRVGQRINKIRTRQFRPVCRGCRYFHGGWDTPVTCWAPKPGETDTSIHWLVGFTKRACPQREQRQLPTTAEGEGC